MYSPAMFALEPDEHLQSLQPGNHATSVFPQMEEVFHEWQTKFYKVSAKIHIDLVPCSNTCSCILSIHAAYSISS